MKEEIHKCEAKDCDIIENVQFVIVKGLNRENGDGFHKEYYCQEHLRKRCAELELLKAASYMGVEVHGWR